MNARASGLLRRGADTRALGLQYGWLLITRLTSSVLQAATLILLARWAGPATFGTVAAVLGVLAVAGALADLGLGPLLLRERSSDPETALTGPVLRLNLITSVVLASCAVTVLAALFGATSNSTFLFLIPLGIWLAAEKNGDLWLNIATAEGRTHLSAVSILLRRGLGLGLFALSAAVLPVGLAFAVGSALGSVVANLVIRTKLDAGPRTPSPRHRLAVVRAAIPFYLNSIAAQARNLDVVIVSALAGPVSAAMYAVPARITSPLRMLPTTLNPIIVRYSALGTTASLRAVKRVCTVVMIVMPLLMLAVALLAPYFIRSALGESYSDAVLPLRIICVGLVFAFAVSLQTSFLQGRGDERYVGRVAVVVTISTVAGLLLGAGLAGSTGAAMAIAINFFVHCALLVPRTIAYRRAA